MNNEKKAITLRGIKRLWKRTGRPIEVPLITKELINQITSQSRQSNEEIVKIDFQFSNNVIKHSHHKWLSVAASVTVLISIGILWTTFHMSTQFSQQDRDSKDMNVNQSVATKQMQERGLIVAKIEHSSSGKSSSHVINRQSNNIKKTENSFVSDSIRNEWWSDIELSPDISEHGNSGMICYSGGSLSSSCDEEMVTSMLLTFIKIDF